MSKQLHRLRLYLYDMAKKIKDKKKPLTMEELTKNFEKFEKENELKNDNKEAFESTLKKAVDKK